MCCDGKPFVEKHKADGEHDCAAEGCVAHECKPMAASTVRQIHSIISSVLNAAVRWEWIETNLAKNAQRPKLRPPDPQPRRRSVGDHWRSVCDVHPPAESSLGGAMLASQ